MSSSTSSALRTVSMFVCILLFASLAQAQYRASLRGTVTDPQGAAIAGATVTLVNPDTNSTMVSTSDSNGIYNFNGSVAGSLPNHRGARGVQEESA